MIENNPYLIGVCAKKILRENYQKYVNMNEQFVQFPNLLAQNNS